MEFQYNNKKYIAIEHTSFKLNFGRYLWKRDLTVKTELPKLEDFLERLQKFWKTAKKSIEIAKEAIKNNLIRKDRTYKD